MAKNRVTIDRMWAIGERLRDRREHAGMDGKEAAKAVGIGKSYLSMLETGASTPNWELLGSIAKLYNTSTDYLLGLTDDPKQTDKRNWTPESQAAIELIDSLPAGKRAAAVAVLKAAIDLDRIEVETNLEPVGARQGGGVTILSETETEPQIDLIAEKDSLLSLADKMFPPDVAAEVRRLVESGQGFTEADIERIISASNQRTLRQRPQLFNNA